MTKRTIKAKIGKDGTEYSAEYDFGDNLKDAVARFGEEVVFSKFIAQSTVDAQGVMRRLIAANKTEAEVQEAVSNWKPGLRQAARKTPSDRIKEQLGKLSDEEKAKLMEQLKKAG